VMDAYELTARAHALPDAFADRLTAADLADVRDCAEAGEWGEEVDLLLAPLRGRGQVITTAERCELMALLEAMGMPTDPVDRLNAS
jgi:hypothetical protein